MGRPDSALAELGAVARDKGGVRLLLGWSPGRLGWLDPDAFADVRTIMGGYGLRTLIEAGTVHYLPARLGTTPALLRETVKPDVLVASVVPGPGGFRFGTEVSWLRAAIDAGARVAAVVRPGLPCADSGPPLPDDRITVVAEDPSPPIRVRWGQPDEVHRTIGAHVSGLVPAGARLQFGPGTVGTGVLDALEVPVAIDTGIISEAVVDLDRRGLLAAEPIAAYLGGAPELYEWAADRPVLAPVEVTHDPGRLAASPLVAVNTALEIDEQGQVNVEAVAGAAVAGVGGHPDYAAAAARSIGGLSIIALPSQWAGRPTLVDRLTAPVTTPSHDVDMVVTERGVADLRGLDRPERRRAIRSIWGM